MKKPDFLLLLVVLFFSACTLLNNKQQTENTENQNAIQPEDSLTQNIIDTIIPDSVQAPMLTRKAFGDLYFGMTEDEVVNIIEKRQLLGKYNYNIKCSFTHDKALYKVNLFSDSEKAINYDSALEPKFSNLVKIVKTKYGEPKYQQKFPSIFYVQKAKKLVTAKWEHEDKFIEVGINENSLNSYSAFCTIVDSEMQEKEKQQLYNNQNKDIIEASEKF